MNFIEAVSPLPHLQKSPLVHILSEIQRLLENTFQYYPPSLGLPSDIFYLGFTTKTLYAPLFSQYLLHARPIKFFLILLPG